MNNTNSTSLPSYLKEVETAVGTFRIHFLRAVFNKDDLANVMVKAVKNHCFKITSETATKEERAEIADQNASELQKALNVAGHLGTENPVFHAEVSWAERKIYVS